MLNRKDAVSMAIVAVLGSVGFAYGADTNAPVAPSLTLDRQALHLDDTAPAAPVPLLTQGLTAIGVQPTLDKYGISIGGYVDSGYIWNHRSHSGTEQSGPFAGEKIGAGGLNNEPHNNYDLDAVDLQISRSVDASKGKWDVGFMVEAMYGGDAAAIHSDGLEYGMSGSDGDRFHPQDQFDLTQAYVDVATPVAGLKVRAGKFVTLLGYETINPNGNAFYSHSYLFGAIPFTHTGILAFYTVNDKLTVAGGISRGWDQALKDNNGSPDGLFQATYQVNKQWVVSLQGTVGPEDTQDTAHWRIAPDLTTTYTINDHWSVGAELLYVYDGGYNNKFGNANQTAGFNADSIGGAAGTYGDEWGGAFYVSYIVDPHFTVNLRGEKLHDYFANGLGASDNAQNFYEGTLGVTITPAPTDKYFSGVKIRPEVRYDWNGNHQDVFPAGRDRSFTDQLTFGADIIVNF